jgi:hypothetical protein
MMRWVRFSNCLLRLCRCPLEEGILFDSLKQVAAVLCDFAPLRETRCAVPFSKWRLL